METIKNQKLKIKNPRYVYFETFGCQMNERDSEIMAALLGRIDYIPTPDMERADLVLLNTCSIRDKAEQKVYSLLGRLRQLKKTKKELIITVAGCVAQQEGGRLLERMEHVDIVIGTRNLHRLPELVERVLQKLGPQVAIALPRTFEIPSLAGPSCPPSPSPDAVPPIFKKFVTIMQGCNNFCTYCVVPHTRGREASRDRDEIIAEVAALVRSGVKEITLLGQNVNSYGLDRGGAPQFPALLRAVAAVEGLERLRFTTSNPKDLSEDLMRCFAELKVLCPHFHLPVQSGSDPVLARMNRKYTVATYLARVEGLRRFRPDIALTTDIIVGFPGESEEDFEATMELLGKVRFHGAFSFKYSDRPGTRSASFGGKVDEEEKSRRLARLQARQNEITLERNREYTGQRLTVLVEGESRNGKGQWQGRTAFNLVVNFPSPPLRPGDSVEVVIEEGCRNSLRGRLAQGKTIGMAE